MPGSGNRSEPAAGGDAGAGMESSAPGGVNRSPASSRPASGTVAFSRPRWSRNARLLVLTGQFDFARSRQSRPTRIHARRGAKHEILVAGLPKQPVQNPRPGTHTDRFHRRNSLPRTSTLLPDFTPTTLTSTVVSIQRRHRRRHGNPSIRTSHSAVAFGRNLFRFRVSVERFIRQLSLNTIENDSAVADTKPRDVFQRRLGKTNVEHGRERDSLDAKRFWSS